MEQLQFDSQYEQESLKHEKSRLEREIMRSKDMMDIYSKSLTLRDVKTRLNTLLN